MISLGDILNSQIKGLVGPGNEGWRGGEWGGEGGGGATQRAPVVRGKWVG